MVSGALWLIIPVVVCAAALSSGCRRAPENKDAVRQAIVQHLEKNAALDVNQLNVVVTDVTFRGNEATAAVSINPKSAPQQGMTMSYTLERRGDKWEVRGRGSGHGGMAGGAEGNSGSAESGAKSTLPPGHPPVNAPAPQTK